MDGHLCFCKKNFYDNLEFGYSGESFNWLYFCILFVINKFFDVVEICIDFAFGVKMTYFGALYVIMLCITNIFI